MSVGCLVGLFHSLTVVGGETNSVPSGESIPDKSQYNLFHPTPVSYMREMSTDRPDKTESPFTVDAGHFQIEMDLVTHTHDHDTRGGDVVTESTSVAAINLKAGLLNDMDLQVMLNPWDRQETKDRVAGTRDVRSGFGDITSRIKYNLWGNDGGKSAMAMMPFVKLPSNQDGLGNHAVESGLILPVAFELPWGFDLGAMTEFDFNRDETGWKYHTEFVNSITLGHDIIGSLSGYVEFFSSVSTERGSDWVGTVDCGLTYGFSKNFRMDCGVNIGVTRAADDINPFLGLSYRY
jgi:hypothetical protein